MNTQTAMKPNSTAQDTPVNRRPAARAYARFAEPRLLRVCGFCEKEKSLAGEVNFCDYQSLHWCAAMNVDVTTGICPEHYSIIARVYAIEKEQ